MDPNYRPMIADFLRGLGTEDVPHSRETRGFSAA